MDNVAALVGLVLLGLAVAGVPDQAGIALVVGGVLLLAPTLAALAGPNPARRTLALFRAMFVHGRPLSDPDVVRETAASVG